MSKNTIQNLGVGRELFMKSIPGVDFIKVGPEAQIIEIKVNTFI